MQLYIDATTGGIGIQMLLAAAVGGFVTIKLFWSRLFSSLRRILPGGQRDEIEDAASTEDAVEIK